MTQNKFVWDTSALLAMHHSLDPHHLACYQFMREHEEDTHIFPTLAWFEVQATLSRIEGGGRQVSRELYLMNGRNYSVDLDYGFMRQCLDGELHLRFRKLRGADLVFACAAVLERATLVTCDKAFIGLEGLDVIAPPDPVASLTYRD
jgi:predicted nucleic acid-binding protein